MTSPTNFLRLQAVPWVRLSENHWSSANILNRSRPCIPIWGRVWRILVWLEMSVLKRKFLVFQSQQSPLLVWIQSVHQQTRKKSHESYRVIHIYWDSKIWLYKYKASSFRLLHLTLWLTMWATKFKKCWIINCQSRLSHRLYNRSDVDAGCNTLPQW